MSDIVTKLITVADIKSNTTIQQNVDGALLEPFVDIAQRIWIFPVLNELLYEALMDDVQTNGLTGITPSHNLLLNQIRPCLIMSTAYEGIPFLRGKITNKNIVEKYSQNSETASEEVVAEMRSAYYQAAQVYQADLKRFLRNNATSYLNWQEDYYDRVERLSGATANSQTYFSGIVFDDDYTDAGISRRIKKFLD